MDTATSSGRAKSGPVMEMERVIAWIVVAIAHLLLAWFATRTSVPRPLLGRPMELVFIQLPPPLPPSEAAARERKTASGPQMAARLKLRPGIGSTTQPTSDGSPTRPLQATIEDDRWSSTSEPATKNDGIQFSRNKLTTSFNPIRAAAPPRLRLRREFSPSDVVRAVSRELFWPPGYTDDPCVGLAKAVEIFSAGSTAREYRLLEDAVLQQSRYCN